MRTFVVDLENGPGNLDRATGALGAAGVDLIDDVGVGEGSGLGLRIWCGSFDAARAAFIRARLSVEELDSSPARHVELVFDDGSTRTQRSSSRPDRTRLIRAQSARDRLAVPSGSMVPRRAWRA